MHFWFQTRSGPQEAGPSSVKCVPESRLDFQGDSQALACHMCLRTGNGTEDFLVKVHPALMDAVTLNTGYFGEGIFCEIQGICCWLLHPLGTRFGLLIYDSR